MGSDQDTEKGTKATPVDVINKALSSKANLTLFVTDPQHWLFCGLTLVALWLTLCLAFQVLLFHPGHVGHPTLLNGFVVACLWFGAISTLFQVTLQESINRFRAMNGRLERDIAGLSNSVEGLQATRQKFRDQLGQFGDIRAQMGEYAAAAGLQFDEVFSKTTDVLENMEKMQTQQTITLLKKTAADVEFMDNVEGVNLSEWRRFCLRAPQPYKDMLREGQEQRFKEVAGDSDVISHGEFMAFVNRFVQECDGP